MRYFTNWPVDVLDEGGQLGDLSGSYTGQLLQHSQVAILNISVAETFLFYMDTDTDSGNGDPI